MFALPVSFVHCFPIFSLLPLFFISRYREWNKATVREFLIHLSTSDSYLCLHVTSISVCSMEGAGPGFCPEPRINSLKLNTASLHRFLEPFREKNLCIYLYPHIKVLKNVIRQFSQIYDEIYFLYYLYISLITYCHGNYSIISVTVRAIN